MGNQGASKNANRPLPVRNCRKPERSLKGCAVLTMPPVSRARLKVASDTRFRRFFSMRLLALIRIIERTHSKPPTAISRATINSVKLASVDRLPLGITRLNTCSI